MTMETPFVMASAMAWQVSALLQVPPSWEQGVGGTGMQHWTQPEIISQLNVAGRSTQHWDSVGTYDLGATCAICGQLRHVLRISTIRDVLTRSVGISTALNYRVTATICRFKVSHLGTRMSMQVAHKFRVSAVKQIRLNRDEVISSSCARVTSLADSTGGHAGSRGCLILTALAYNQRQHLRTAFSIMHYLSIAGAIARAEEIG